jgi:hypothetical protein
VKSDSEFENRVSDFDNCVTVTSAVNNRSIVAKKRHSTPLPFSATRIDGTHGLCNGSDVLFRCGETASSRLQRHDSCEKVFQSQGKAFQNSKTAIQSSKIALHVLSRDADLVELLRDAIVGKMPAKRRRAIL